MSDSVIVAIISALVTILTVVISSKSTQDKVTAELHTQNEVQNVKIQNLTDEVKKHNDFANRIPVIEGEIKVLKEKASVANHRIDDIEKKIN